VMSPPPVQFQDAAAAAWTGGVLLAKKCDELSQLSKQQRLRCARCARQVVWRTASVRSDGPGKPEVVRRCAHFAHAGGECKGCAAFGDAAGGGLGGARDRTMRWFAVAKRKQHAVECLGPRCPHRETWWMQLASRQERWEEKRGRRKLEKRRRRKLAEEEVKRRKLAEEEVKRRKLAEEEMHRQEKEDQRMFNEAHWMDEFQ
jgi:hypothetical protein